MGFLVTKTPAQLFYSLGIFFLLIVAAIVFAVAGSEEEYQQPVTVTFLPTQTAVPTPVPTYDPEARKLIWPVSGPIASYMDYSHPLGIDIDLNFDEAQASPILAATDGIITFAGGDPCCQYGNHIILMSPAGIETVYGHLRKIKVSVGESVVQEQEIGVSGCTGYCTGEHLHFEVIDNGVRVDPLSYLP